MSKTSRQPTGSESLESTGVFHDGDEVAVRAYSTHSRTAHAPKTDEAGDVVFVDSDDPDTEVPESHDRAEPLPACGLPSGDVADLRFLLKPIDDVSNRKPCAYCTDSCTDPAEGAGNKSFARRLRYGETWGEDTE